MYTNIVLPKEKKGIHVFQFSVPLTASDSYFSIDVRKTGKLITIMIYNFIVYSSAILFY